MRNYLNDHTILTYDDVVQFPAGENGEQLVDVRTYDTTIESEYMKEDMLEITGNIIYVRDELAKRLATANRALKAKNLHLRVVYGYRHPEVQGSYFIKRWHVLREENPRLSDEELDRLTHNFVAIPDVAGHPTGGAVDLTVVDANGRPVDMGTEIADYADPQLIQTFDPRVTETEKANRLSLHDAMVAAGFAPFYGEWWHFSYGDREWAAFYDKKSARYGAVDINL